MGKSKAAWLKNPSKKQVLRIFITWFVSIFLITIAMTNFFSQKFFQNGYITIYFLIIIATGIVIRVYSNYRKMHSPRLKNFNEAKEQD